MPEIATEQPLVTLADYEPCARARLPHMVYEYIAGGDTEDGSRAIARAARSVQERVANAGLVVGARCTPADGVARALRKRLMHE